MVPTALRSPFDLEVEESVLLAQGAIKVRRGHSTLNLDNGHISLNLRGDIEVTFDATGTTRDPVWMERALMSWEPTRVVCPELGLRGPIIAAELDGDFRRQPYRPRVTGRFRWIEGGTATRLKQVIFHLVNFPDFVGSPIRDEASSWRGRLDLVTPEWQIGIESRRTLSELTRELRKRGGYGITHVASLSRVDRARFSRESALDVLVGLHWFLSFVRGAWTSPVLFEGLGVRSSVWHHWGSGRVEPARGAFSWADPTAWASVAEAYHGYTARWADPVWQQALKVAIGQYISANDPSPVETAIIAAQSGLELLSWMQLVESGLVPEADWNDKRRYPASRKIAELLHLGLVDVSIPPALSSLHGLDRNWRTGPEVLAGVRNQLVHPRRTRRGVGWGGAILTDAWLLGSSYLELALLFALRVSGSIRNRILSPSPWVGATIQPPWVPP